jgi:prepilin-type N-terminal cleavage/methylation domain-containing protein
MARNRNTSRRGFSLIELVIVVVIIGIIAAIAIPRMSRGTAGAADSALSGNLTVLRNAIELYATEHNGKFPTSAINNQLTQYTDDGGAAQVNKDGTHIYGPYLRKIPPIAVGPLKSDTTKNFIITTGADDTTTGATGGWWYNTTTGAIRANTTAEVDQNNKLYTEY